MRRFLVMMLGLAAPAIAQPVDPMRIPMPMDIPPHHTHSVVGPHHYDIQPEQYEERCSPGHVKSYGQHNYDMSEDPSNRERFYVDSKRWRGMGLGQDERYSMMRRSLEDIDDHAERPWVTTNLHRRGLAYRIPDEGLDEELSKRAVGFPRPSWYAIYKKDKRVHRE